MIRGWCVVLLSMSLAGCSGWLIGETPRLPSWRIIMDHQDVAVADDAVSARLVVNRPAVAAHLQTRALLVVGEDGRLSQVSTSQWAELPSRMLQRHLAERLSAAQRFADVSTDSFRPSDEIVLHIALLRFEVEETADGLQAIGVWELRLPHRQIQAQRVEVRRGVEGNGPEAMIRALQAVGSEMVVGSAESVITAFAEG